MSIEFHCDHCGRLIRAPREAAGRRGKCPNCQQSVYIRMPPEDLDEVPLAPVDEAAEEAERRADEEARRLAQQLLHEREAGADVRPSAASPRASEELSPEVIEESVLAYLTAMADGQLDRAETIAEQLADADAPAVTKVIDRLAQDPLPPPGCESVPPPVLRGFLNTLREKL